ncbi:hypothetical protein jhhlp_008546 [Lomentospora prolificans]|uniref:Uncharacterized protein n=1 Tax=Lomentospora prolificans TaxID=41688 RepID=A0A2N3MYC4_9PEZI|nr:hypothetical protein jhhlp_008546 [Lomentospora prolificans]
MFRKNKSVHFDAAKDIPPLDGKIIIVTGANNGLGKQSVLELAKHNPSQIWLAARSLAKGQAALEDIKKQAPDANIKLLELDLASFDSVRKAAQTFLSEATRLDILMLNAGIMAAPPGLTRDGYEMQFGTNHMGHAFFAKLLLPTLVQTAAVPGSDVRVVSLSSDGHAMLSKGGFDFNSLKTDAEAMGAYNRYFQSKLANVLWARQLAKEYPQLTVAAVHPGLVNTNLLESATDGSAILTSTFKLFKNLMNSPETGARNQLWACFSKDLKSGEYYVPVGVHGKASVDGMDDALAKRLWE